MFFSTTGLDAEKYFLLQIAVAILSDQICRDILPSEYVL